MTRNGNEIGAGIVQTVVRRVVRWVIPLTLVTALSAAYVDYLSAKQKFDLIEAERLRPGSRVELSPKELNAWVQQSMPEGVRNARIQIPAPGQAKGTALVDFGKVSRAQGNRPGWLMSKVLDGERPVSVTARITSSGGHAQVDVERVEISGLEIDGRTLDFLIDHVLLSLYPDAAVGRPFELGHRMERLDVAPQGVKVEIGR